MNNKYKITINGYSQSPELELPVQKEQEYELIEDNDERAIKYLITNVISCYLTSKNKLSLKNIEKFNNMFKQ